MKNNFKSIFALLSIYTILQCAGCQKNEPTPKEHSLIGTWIEMYPDKYDGIRDTIEFTADSVIKKHFAYKDWKYSYDGETLRIFNADWTHRYPLEFVNKDRIVIYYFIEHTARGTQEVDFKKQEHR